MQAAGSFAMPWLQQANADVGKCFEDTRLEWPNARFTAAARTQGSTPSSTNWLSRVNEQPVASLQPVCLCPLLVSRLTVSALCSAVDLCGFARCVCCKGSLFLVTARMPTPQSRTHLSTLYPVCACSLPLLSLVSCSAIAWKT